MPRPIALLLGTVTHARSEWDSLSDVAELREINAGTRKDIIADLRGGKWDGVVAISRTYHSVNITGRFDQELVDALPASVKFICHNGAGYDQIDVEPCTKRGIAVSHTPLAVDNATANVAMMLLLGALRKSWIFESSLRVNTWQGGFPLGHDPEGKTLGILGMGGIGTALSTRAAAFQMSLIYHNRHPVPDSHNPAGARYVADLQEFLKSADIISIHLPLSPATHHLISAPEFAAMKDGVVIVNTARGAIIDEAALVTALESGKVGAAGLDVFENEPTVHSGLIQNKNTVLFPHIGTATWETQKKMECLVIDNVRSAVAEGVLKTQVPEQKKLENKL